MALHLIVLLVAIFKFLIGMPTQSYEDRHIVSLASCLHYRDKLRLATECKASLILWLPLQSLIRRLNLPLGSTTLLSTISSNIDMSSITCSYLAQFPASVPKIFPPKNFLYFLLKKTCSEKFHISSQTKPPPPQFSGNGASLQFIKRGFSYISGKVYSEPQHIYNPRRNSEHRQTFTMERFAKIATQRTIRAETQKIKKVFIFFHNYALL